MTGRSRSRAGSVARVVLAMVAMASVMHYRDDVHPANEASRIYAALALVDHGTVALDPVFDDVAPGWRAAGRPPNLDVAVFEGSYRLDKAPGVTLLAVPVVAAIRAAGGHPSFATLTWLLALLLAALPSAAFAEMLRRRLRRERVPGGNLWAAGLVLATPWLAYGGMLFGHALAGSLAGAGVLLALGPLARQGEGVPATTGDVARTGRRAARSLLAGLLLGLAVLAEYPVALLAVLACAALAADRRWRALGFVVLGALPAAATLLAWNAANFGSPFAMSYGFKNAAAFAAIHSQGAYGMTWPSAQRLFGLLLGPTRGLLFLAPWLAGGLAGAVVAAFDRDLARPWRVVLAVGVPAWCLWISGFVDWTAGASIGPRHLLAGLPLLVIGAPVMARRVAAYRAGPVVLAAMAGGIASSFLLDAVAAWTFPYADKAIVNPVAELAMPVLLEAGTAPTAWDAFLPVPAGALLALAAALVLLLPALFRRVTPRALAVAVTVATLHLWVATLPETPPGDTKRLLQNRAWAFEMLGRDDLAAAVRAGMRREAPPPP